MNSITLLLPFLLALPWALSAATPVDQLRSQAAEIIARDRKGEPAEVILEKSLRGKKEKNAVAAVPVVANSSSAQTSSASRDLSRFELWQRHRAETVRNRNSAAAGTTSVSGK